MPLRALDAAASALSAYGVPQQVTANNIANVNTDGFDPSRVTLEERPDRSGVAVQEVREMDVQGPPVPASVPVRGPDGTVAAASGYVEGSGTDLVRETVNLISNQRAYEAAAVVVRTEDEMVGQFLDDMV